MRRDQLKSAYLLVQVPDLGRVGAKALGQKRADRLKFRQCVTGMSCGGEHLGDDEAGFQHLGCLVLVSRGVGVLCVEPQVRKGLVRVADLSVGVARIIGAVEDVRVGRREIPAVSLPMASSNDAARVYSPA